MTSRIIVAFSAGVSKRCDARSFAGGLTAAKAAGILALCLSGCGGDSGSSGTMIPLPNALSPALASTPASTPAVSPMPVMSTPESEPPPPSHIHIDKVLLKVKFSGSFTTTTGYTPATGEIINGSLSRATGKEVHAAGTLSVAGGTQGFSFTPNTSLVNGFDVTSPLLMEARVKAGGGRSSALTAIISAFGGIYYRFESGSSQSYGMYAHDAPYYDTTFAAPSSLSANAFDHVALSYQPKPDGSSSLTAFVNGCALPDVVSIPRLASVAGNVVMFGNDVQVPTRGANALFQGVAVSTLTGPAASNDFQLEAPPCKGTTGGGLEGETGEPVPLAETISVIGDRPGRIVEKSGYVVPTQAQYDWQSYGLTAFLHYGMNTFLDKEWSFGQAAAINYAPTDIDPDQWMKTLKRNGFKVAILTVKHHDGFLLYPTRYSKYSVKYSPWWTQNADASGVNPKRNVLKQFAEAARNNGMKIGVYLSPADGAEINDQTRQGGRSFSNGSQSKAVTIPVLVAGDDRVRDPAKTYSTTADDYNTYFMNQLYEVLTEYGTIHEVWFDGANPYESNPQPYQFKDWYALIRKLQPNALISVSGPDIRWIGSESGAFRPNEWSPQAFTGTALDLLKDGNLVGDVTSATLGSARSICGIDLPSGKRPSYLSWWPAEADVSIRPGWFWHANQDNQVKDSDTLFSLYENAVGRNAVLLLNTPPNKDGVLSDPDVKALNAFGTLVQATYGSAMNLLSASQATPELQALVDGDSATDWTPGIGKTTGSFDLVSPVDLSFNRVLLQENIKKGQRIESISVSARMADGSWSEIASAGSVGYKRILPLAATVKTKAVRVTIKQARAQPFLGSVELYMKQ